MSLHPSECMEEAKGSEGVYTHNGKIYKSGFLKKFKKNAR